MGYQALQGNSSNTLSGSNNSAFGSGALSTTQGASVNNTALGYDAGYSNIAGTDNTLLGYEAGYGVTGSHNIILGEDPSSAVTSGSNNILIGNSLTKVTNSSSNQLDIGDVFFANLTTGSVGIGTASPQAPLEMYSSGSGVLLQLAGSGGTCNHTPGSSSETVSCSSDMRFKSNVIDAPSALPWLSSIRVRDFTWKNAGQKRTGVIAQELRQTHPEMVIYDAKKDEWTVEQPNPWVLVKLLQEQQAEIDDLKKRLAAIR
jgi:hypothetical protein